MRNSTIHLLKKLFPLVVALTFCSCFGAGSASADDRPQSEAFRAELKRAASSVNVTFETSSQALTAALNQMIGNELYKGSTIISGLTADILRNGPMSLTAADNYLYLTLPITMSLRYGGYITPAVSSKLKFRLNAKVTPDWKLIAEIHYLGLSDLLAEEMGIGLLSIKPRSIIEGITQPLQKVLSEVISKKINEKYSLKAEMQKVWTAAQKPVLLDKNYSAWLLHSKIRNIIKENINMNLTQRIQQVHEMAQKAMDQVKLTDRIFLKGSVKALKLHDVMVQKDKLSIQLYAEGESTVHFR